MNGGREIKFRAWDIKDKCWIYYSLIQAEIGRLTDFGLRLESRCQFTGLKDKNGVEIYEGDIVKVHIFTQELGENMGVYEGEKEFVASISFGSMGVELIRGKEESGPIWSYYGFHEDSLEIIGNIYEHEHLLSQRQKGKE